MTNRTSNQSKSDELHFAIVSTDIVLIRNNNGVLEFATKLVNPTSPYKNMPGHLGGVISVDEIAIDAAKRIIAEKSEVEVSKVTFLPLGFYDAVDRDLRGRVVSLAHLGIMSSFTSDYGLVWYPLYTKIALAYDHNKMLLDTIAYIKSHLTVSVVSLYCMPKTFTIRDLKCVFDYVNQSVADKRNFYKFIEDFPIEEAEVEQKKGRGRPAQIYKRKAHKEFFLTKK